MQRFGFFERREVADELWRLFQMISDRIVISCDSTGINIRIAFNEPQDLDGPVGVHGTIEGYKEYKELAVHTRRP